MNASFKLTIDGSIIHVEIDGEHACHICGPAHRVIFSLARLHSKRKKCAKKGHAFLFLRDVENSEKFSIWQCVDCLRCEQRDIVRGKLPTSFESLSELETCILGSWINGQVSKDDARRALDWSLDEFDHVAENVLTIRV